MSRTALLTAALGSAWLTAVLLCFCFPQACAPTDEIRGTAVEVSLDPSLSAGAATPFEAFPKGADGWYARRMTADSGDLMERVELWCLEESGQLKAWARISRYEESERVSGVEIDEVAKLHGTVRVNALGLPGIRERRAVAYDLEGMRGDQRIRRTGSFEFRAADVQH